MFAFARLCFTWRVAASPSFVFRSVEMKSDFCSFFYIIPHSVFFSCVFSLSPSSAAAASWLQTHPTCSLFSTFSTLFFCCVVAFVRGIIEWDGWTECACIVYQFSLNSFSSLFADSQHCIQFPKLRANKIIQFQDATKCQHTRRMHWSAEWRRRRNQRWRTRQKYWRAEARRQTRHRSGVAKHHCLWVRACGRIVRSMAHPIIGQAVHHIVRYCSLLRIGLGHHSRRTQIVGPSFVQGQIPVARHSRRLKYNCIPGLCLTLGSRSSCSP